MDVTVHWLPWLRRTSTASSFRREKEWDKVRSDSCQAAVLWEYIAESELQRVTPRRPKRYKVDEFQANNIIVPAIPCHRGY